MLTKSRVMEKVWPERMLAGFDDVMVQPVMSKENACAAACCLINAGVKLNKMAISSGGCWERFYVNPSCMRSITKRDSKLF